MRKRFDISVEDIEPEMDEVLKTQGMPSGKNPPKKIKSLFQESKDIFLKYAEPVGIISDISVFEFETVYRGEGLNEKKTPLGEILKKANNLALFALTIGERVSENICELFKTNEFALGSMLDSVASAGTDKGGDILEGNFFNLIPEKGKTCPQKGILRFSPGYCGWHMSGQKKLFEFLRPEDIGITLSDSFLMVPLKSISGVIVFGDKEIFDFDDNYTFCEECKTHECRDRIKKLLMDLRAEKEKGGR
jgi:hypothetical protein